MSDDNPTPCERCGQPHPNCKAHKRDGNPCGQRAMRGQRVCKMHGGMKGAARANGVQRVHDAAAMAAATTFGLPREVDPHTALLEELHRTAGAVAWLGLQVQSLEREDVTWGMVREKTGGEDYGTTYEAAPDAWVRLWQSERKHLVEVSKACLAAGIAERQVALAEAAGQQLAGVIRAVLDRLDLSPGQQVLVGQVVPEELRRLSAGGGAA